MKTAPHPASRIPHPASSGSSQRSPFSLIYASARSENFPLLSPWLAHNQTFPFPRRYASSGCQGLCLSARSYTGLRLLKHQKPPMPLASPFYRQRDAMDCGPTCLMMASVAYGRQYPLTYLRERQRMRDRASPTAIDY